MMEPHMIIFAELPAVGGSVVTEVNHVGFMCQKFDY
jgi:hypothetical protein